VSRWTLRGGSGTGPSGRRGAVARRHSAIRIAERGAATRSAKAVLEATDWDPILAAHDRLVIFPDFFCEPQESTAVQLELQARAVRNSIPVNSTAGHL
jgi:hypothetical protein